MMPQKDSSSTLTHEGHVGTIEVADALEIIEMAKYTFVGRDAKNLAQPVKCCYLLKAKNQYLGKADPGLVQDVPSKSWHGQCKSTNGIRVVECNKTPQGGQGMKLRKHFPLARWKINGQDNNRAKEVRGLHRKKSGRDA